MGCIESAKNVKSRSLSPNLKPNLHKLANLFRSLVLNHPNGFSSESVSFRKKKFKNCSNLTQGSKQWKIGVGTVGHSDIRGLFRTIGSPFWLLPTLMSSEGSSHQKMLKILKMQTLLLLIRVCYLKFRKIVHRLKLKVLERIYSKLKDKRSRWKQRISQRKFLK
jgi:hypothetical protein